mmetsp:Transcript_14815/g.36986  ORF Transcript_14815/g.36986 Transcript_14815/m.36986 type:complete len:112 (-) Transcript_14815:1041-1376(-)
MASHPITPYDCQLQFDTCSTAPRSENASQKERQLVAKQLKAGPWASASSQTGTLQPNQHCTRERAAAIARAQRLSSTTATEKTLLGKLRCTTEASSQHITSASTQPFPTWQ